MRKERKKKWLAVCVCVGRGAGWGTFQKWRNRVECFSSDIYNWLSKHRLEITPNDVSNLYYSWGPENRCYSRDQYPSGYKRTLTFPSTHFLLHTHFFSHSLAQSFTLYGLAYQKSFGGFFFGGVVVMVSRGRHYEELCCFFIFYNFWISFWF